MSEFRRLEVPHGAENVTSGSCSRPVPALACVGCTGMAGASRCKRQTAIADVPMVAGTPSGSGGAAWAPPVRTTHGGCGAGSSSEPSLAAAPRQSAAGIASCVTK